MRISSCVELHEYVKVYGVNVRAFPVDLIIRSRMNVIYERADLSRGLGCTLAFGRNCFPM